MMWIEIPITEVQDFLSNYYKINVGLKNIGEDKIEADYLVLAVVPQVNIPKGLWPSKRNYLENISHA